MRAKESFTKELQEILSRLNELAGNYDKKEPQALDELDEIAEKYDETVKRGKISTCISFCYTSGLLLHRKSNSDFFYGKENKYQKFPTRYSERTCP